MSVTPDIAAALRVLPPLGTVSMEVSMSIQPDHHTDHNDVEALWPALWIGLAMVAMVVFSYWLNIW
jgi:hypothetical protein